MSNFDLIVVDGDEGIVFGRDVFPVEILLGAFVPDADWVSPSHEPRDKEGEKKQEAESAEEVADQAEHQGIVTAAGGFGGGRPHSGQTPPAGGGGGAEPPGGRGPGGGGG